MRQQVQQPAGDGRDHALHGERRRRPRRARAAAGSGSTAPGEATSVLSGSSTSTTTPSVRREGSQDAHHVHSRRVAGLAGSDGASVVPAPIWALATYRWLIMVTFVAVFAMVLAYIALVTGYLALRTLARLRASTTVLAKMSADGHRRNLVEITEEQVRATAAVAAELEQVRSRAAGPPRRARRRGAGRPAADQRSAAPVERAPGLLPRRDRRRRWPTPSATSRWCATTRSTTWPGGCRSRSRCSTTTATASPSPRSPAGPTPGCTRRAIQGGRSDHELSPEEDQAVTAAIRSRAERSAERAQPANGAPAPQRRRRQLALLGVTAPRIAFLGPLGTFAHACLLTLPVADGAELLPHDNVTLAIDALRAGAADAAFVPIENSVEGAVPATLGRAGRRRAAGHRPGGLPAGRVRPAGPPGHDPRRHQDGRDPSARRGAGAPLADHQPAGRPRQPGRLDRRARPRPSAQGEYDAAVCPAMAGELYGLQTVAHDIADNPGAVTRFVLLTHPHAAGRPDRQRPHHARGLPRRRPFGRAASSCSSSSRPGR